MPMGSTKAKELPDKECFYMWAEMHSTTKVSECLARDQQLISPTTGYAYHPTSIRNAALRYVMENMEETRQVMIDRGVSLAKKDAEWYDWIVHKAWTRWNATPRSFIRWMRGQNLDVEKYSYVYGKRKQFVLELNDIYDERYT